MRLRCAHGETDLTDTAGIGTYVVSNDLTRTGLKARIKSWYTKAKDSAIGSSFDQHVVGGYRFLMRYYDPGDEIYIFGFSRGAYIARFLAEMLDYVGLLSHGNEEMVIFAWKAFASWQSRRASKSPKEIKKKQEMYTFMKGFRETFSRPVRRIRFLGLFDTVNSVPRFETAWMERSKFPYTARTSAKVIRHAVSIDERRAKFRQDLIYQSDRTKGSTKRKAGNNATQDKPDHVPEGGQRYRERGSLTPAHFHAEDSQTPRGRHQTLEVPVEEGRFRARSHSRSGRSLRSHQAAEIEPDDDVRSIASAAPHPHDEDASVGSVADSDESDQDIDEVWFAGGHADIGGGWELEPGERKPASHVPLVWMVHEAMKAGLKFDMDKVREMGCAEALDEKDEEVRNASNYRCPEHSRVELWEVQYKLTTRKGKLAEATTAAPGNQAVTVPNIIVRSPTTSSPILLQSGESSREASPTKADNENGTESHQTFKEMMHKASTARIHDSLEFGGGLPPTSVLAWKIMEYVSPSTSLDNVSP
jgi:uncharacterized protein (DUF2235 family)